MLAPTINQLWVNAVPIARVLYLQTQQTRDIEPVVNGGPTLIQTLV